MDKPDGLEISMEIALTLFLITMTLMVNMIQVLDFDYIFFIILLLLKTTRALATVVVGRPIDDCIGSIVIGTAFRSPGETSFTILGMHIFIFVIIGVRFDYMC